jgi:hypothetical protein
VTSVRVNDQDQSLEVACQSPAAVFADLPRMSERANAVVQELRSVEEPLKELFGTLLRFHRGENRPSVGAGLNKQPASQMPV